MKKRHIRRRLIWTAAGLLAVAAAPGAAWADTSYPSKPITFIVPFPAGGGVDNLARMLLPGLEKRLGQTIVVENRGGAGGTIGTTALARAAPDGYTLGVVFDTHATAPLIYKQLPYSITDDFESVIGLARMPMVIAVPVASPYNTLAEFMSAAKAAPGKLTYASPGAGSSNHLAAVLFSDMADIQMTHVPYRGGAPAMTDLAGGHVDAMFQNPLTTMPFVTSGRLKVIGMTAVPEAGSTRYAPPISDTLPGYEVYSWMALIAPGNTPAAIIQRVNAAMNEVLADPAIVERLNANGLEATGGTPADLDEVIHGSTKKWAEIIRRENISAG